MTEQKTSRTRQDIESHIIAQAWKNEAYKQELLSNPKAVIEREFGVKLPPEFTVQIKEESPSNLYFVLPMRPDLSAAELSEEQLEAVAGGTSLPCAGAVSFVACPFVAGAIAGAFEGD
jgi:hypothetical protein